MPSTQLLIVPRPENPSIADVIDAFARAYDPDPARTALEFMLRVSGTERRLTFKVTSLRYESGTAGMFLLEGLAHLENPEKPGGGGFIDGEMFYDARPGKRTGHFFRRDT